MDTTNLDAGIWKSAPGKGRKTPKGRQLEDTSVIQIRELLGERPREGHLLIEFLHLIQDQYGYLSLPHMTALADELRLSQTEVYEVATFYAHFNIIKNSETFNPVNVVRVCESLTCELLGAKELLKEIKKLENKKK